MADSRRGVQYVHVGQPVAFFFDISGPADYAEIFFGAVGQPETLKPDDQGRFRCEQTFDRPGPSDQPVTVEALAYLVRGRQDRMFIDGEAISRQPSDDVADRCCAQASLRLCVYQSQLTFTIPADEAPATWASARLILYRKDGRTTTLYQARGSAPGFAVAGPNESNQYVVTYQPQHDQIDLGGTTRATLIAHDRTGQLRTWQQDLSTP